MTYISASHLFLIQTNIILVWYFDSCCALHQQSRAVYSLGVFFLCCLSGFKHKTFSFNLLTHHGLTFSFPDYLDFNHALPKD